jgi:hypothetical protein
MERTGLRLCHVRKPSRDRQEAQRVLHAPPNESGTDPLLCASSCASSLKTLPECRASATRGIAPLKAQR